MSTGLAWVWPRIAQADPQQSIARSQSSAHDPSKLSKPDTFVVQSIAHLRKTLTQKQRLLVRMVAPLRWALSD